MCARSATRHPLSRLAGGCVFLLLWIFPSAKALAQVQANADESSLRAASGSGSISGHVYRADTGEPLAGVVLTLNLTRWQRPVAGPPAPPPAVRTGADGAYTFSSVEANDYTIQIWPRGGFIATWPPTHRATVAAGEATRGIDFRLEPAAAVSGSVLDEYNDPLPGLTAVVFCPDPNDAPGRGDYPGYRGIYTTTDDRGEFRVSGVAPGRCYVAIAADQQSYRAPLKRIKFYPDADTMEKAQAIEVKPGQEVTDLQFRFPLALSGILGALRPAQQILPFPSPGPTMGSVSGHVYRADTGAPIAGAILHLHPIRAPDRVQGDAPVPSPLAARTGPDGAYTFATVEAREYGVSVECQGFAPLSFEGSPERRPDPDRISISPGQEPANFDFKLQPTGAISGSVRDQDGIALQGLMVTAFCSNSGSPDTRRAEGGRATTDDRGDFRISGIIPGDCDVGAGPVNPLNMVGYRGSFYPNAATMENAHPVPVKAGGESPAVSLVVRYSPTYTITVKVLENERASGQQIYLVRLVPADPAAKALVNTFGFGAALLPVTTSADGTAVLRGTTAGDYNIYVNTLREAPARGPTVRRPDGTIDPRGARGNHALIASGPAAGSASVQVADRDVCVQLPLTDRPPSMLLQEGPQPAEKCGQTATETASRSPSQREGCSLLPYEGKQPEDQSPLNPDLSGGMVCRFFINPNLPLYTFRFVADGDNPVGKIEISEGESAKVIQTISYSGEPAMGGFPDPLHNVLNPADANFDGYKDLPLLTGCGAVGNCTYEFYLYDPASNRFVPNALLSGLVMPEIHPQDKTVTTYTHMSAFDGSGETYQYRNGQYVLIEKWESTWDREKDIVTTKTYKLLDGKMQLAKCEGECSQKP